MVCGRLECSARGRNGGPPTKSAALFIPGRTAPSTFSPTTNRSTTFSALLRVLETATQHLKDGDDLVRDIDAGTLPPVAFYKPTGILNQHPAYTDLMTGDAHVADILEQLKRGPQWSRDACHRYI